jgi:hypothetical protein
VRRVAAHVAGAHVAHDDAAGRPVDDHEVEHLALGVELHAAEAHHAHHLLVRAEQQLLAGLPASVERARHLRAAEGAVREQAPVLPRERHPLRDRLVDDVEGVLGEAVHIRLAGAEVSPLDRVVE